MSPQHLSEADGFALVMIAMILLSIGVVAMLMICGLRNAARRDQQVDDLLDEVDQEEGRKRQTPAKGEAPKSQPWEREDDWWKK